MHRIHPILFLPSEYRNIRKWWYHFIEAYKHIVSQFSSPQKQKSLSAILLNRLSSVSIRLESFLSSNDQRMMQNEKRISLTPLYTLRISFRLFWCKTQILSISSSILILHIKLAILSHPLTLLCVTVFERVFFFSVSAETQTTLHPVAAVAHSRSVSHI